MNGRCPIYNYQRWNPARNASQLFSGVLTTQRQHFIYSDQNFISCGSRASNPSDNHLDLVALLAHVTRHESVDTPYVLNKIISQCAISTSPEIGIQLHSKVFKMGFNSNIYISSAMLDLYGKCGRLKCAHQLFDEMYCRNVVTWNSLISGYVNTNCPQIAIDLFIKMMREDKTPTSFSVSVVLVACAQLEAGELGAQVHCLSFKAGFYTDVVVGTSLIDMYSKSSNVEASRRMFNCMPHKNVVTWTSMVNGYAQNKLPKEAMILVKKMLHCGLKSNHVTYNALLSSFYGPDDFDHCKQIHCRIIREGLEFNAYLVVTLVTKYSDCGGSIEELYKICSSLTVWDQVLYNAIIAGLSNLENSEEALECFSKMQQAGVNIDFFTFPSILRAIGIVSALEVGRQSHAIIFKTGYESILCVQNGLVSMYARCGKIDDAKKVFYSMENHDLVSWNSLLSGCAYHGHGSEVVELFEQMGKTGVRPDLTTFLAALTACSHAGLLDKGLEYFELMRNDYFLPNPKVDHYACIVDLYSRAGYLHEAESFINCMPIQPGPSIFKALLSACQVHGNKEIGVRAARNLVEFHPNDPATYVLLSNVLATGGSWDDAAGVRDLMCDRGVKKMPAFSWI